MTAQRLRDGVVLKPGVAQPAYQRAAHGVGIVHLGVGAFHRAHQAVYTDDALAAEGGDWRIVGASLRSTATADALTAQDGLYTLVERWPDGPRARVIGSLAAALSGPRDGAALNAYLAAPTTRIVSLTVSEKAYGINRATGGADNTHPAVKADLAQLDAPTGVLGRLVAAFGARRAASVPPFTVLVCDNLPNNGAVVRGAVVDFAARLDPALAAWIEAEAAFPCTMVDRITPARTGRTVADALALTGARDEEPVETEPFRQFVIEDRFPLGRPAWEAGGALFVADVAPFEAMKLAMLNGPHSLIAYAGVVAGYTHVRDAMANRGLRAAVRQLMAAAAATLDPAPEGIDLCAYADDLVARFDNAHLAHETYQIAMDGTEKLAQRILEPAARALAQGASLRPFAFAVAAWMRYARGVSDAGERYALRDPRETELARVVTRASDVPHLVDGLLRVGALDREPLASAPKWREEVTGILSQMLERPMAAVIDAQNFEAPHA